jgi:hypothetical protein
VNRWRRIVPVVLVLAGLGVWSWISPRTPHDQSVDVLLGDRAPEVEDVTVRYTQDREPARQVAFHYAHGSAPRIVHHTPHLADGDYGVDIELASATNGFSSVHRSVTLKEGTSTQIHAETAK